MIRCISAFIGLFFCLTLQSQNSFIIEERGLHPTSKVISAEDLNRVQVFQKVLHWVEERKYSYDTIINSDEQRLWIRFKAEKKNSIKLHKQMHHIQASITISLRDGQYTFKPVALATKLNSKYDMGWNKIELENSSEFFKNGKPLKKTRSYIKELAAYLNELFADLESHVQSR